MITVGYEEYLIRTAWYGKVCVYSIQGNKIDELKNLSKAIEACTEYKDTAKEDEAFKNLWDDEAFKDLWDDEDFKKIVG